MSGPGLLRAALVVAVVVGASAAGHLAGGGEVPAAPRLAFTLLLVGLLAALAGGAKVPVWRLTLVVGAGQVVLHHGLAPPGTGHCADHRPAAVAAVFGPDAAQVPCGPGSLAHAMGWDPAMVVAHLATTVVAVLMLRRGEAALRALVDWASRTLALAGPVRFASPAPPSGATRTVPAPRRARLGEPVRGPPGPALLTV